MRAVMFALLPNGKTTTDVIEGPGCLEKAHALMKSCQPDFPGGLFAVTGDEEAAKDRTDSIMRRLGFRGES